MRKMLVCLSLAAIVGLSGCSLASKPQAEKKTETQVKKQSETQAETAAVAAAEAWLSLVDEENYAESWEQAAQFFKGAVQKEQWIQTMQSARQPFGKSISRELRSKSYETTFPGAPDGEYVVIEFTTSFENKKSAIETITPMLDKDGKWRVSGYFVK